MSAPRVINKHHGFANMPDSVYIGRPSEWGNPFEIGKDGTRDEVCDKFEQKLREHPNRDAIVQHIRNELKGKSLICYCAPKRCHGDLLLRIANSEGDPFAEPEVDVVHQLNGNPFDGLKEAIPATIECLRGDVRYLEDLINNEKNPTGSRKDMVTRWRTKANKLKLAADWLEQKLKEL